MSHKREIISAKELPNHPFWGPRIKQIIDPLQALAPDDTKLCYDGVDWTKRTDEKGCIIEEEGVWVWYQPGFGQWNMMIYVDRVEISTDEDKASLVYRRVPDDQVVSEFTAWLARNYESKQSMKRKRICSQIVQDCVRAGDIVQELAKGAKKAMEFVIPEDIAGFFREDLDGLRKKVKEAEEYNVTRESVVMLTRKVITEVPPEKLIPTLREYLEVLPSALDKAEEMHMPSGAMVTIMTDSAAK